MNTDYSASILGADLSCSAQGTEAFTFGVDLQQNKTPASFD